MRVVEDELHAYVDGLLPPGDRARIESYLSRFPEERERIETYRHQNVLLHRLFDWHTRPLDDTVYENLTDRYRRAEQANDRIGRFARVAAVLAVVLVSGGIGWTSYGLFAGPEVLHTEFIHQAAEAHSLTNSGSFSENRFAAGGSADTNLLDWIASEKKTVPRRAPDFRQSGFQLVGGRVLPTGYGPAVQFLYADTGKRRVTLFIGRPRSAAAPLQTLVEDGTLTMIHRQKGALAYSLIGNVQAKQLMGMADIVSASLENRRPGDTKAATVDDLRPSPLAQPSLPAPSIKQPSVEQPSITQPSIEQPPRRSLSTTPLARPENISRPAPVDRETQGNPTKRF